MSILVTTCIISSTGDSVERSLKVGISVGDVTLGDIGRHFWPHVYNTIICSVVQIYDEDVDDYVDVFYPDKVIVQPRSKIRIKFVQSRDISVIRPPTSFAVRGSAEGATTIIGHSTCQFASEPGKQPRVCSSTVIQKDSAIDRTQKDSAPELVDLVLPAENAPIQGCLDHNQEIVVVEDQIKQPETHKRRHSKSYGITDFSTSPLLEIRKFAEKVGMDAMETEVLLNRLLNCSANPDPELIDILSAVIVNWLNENAPEHSIQFRQTVVKNFISELFSKEKCNIQVFTNKDCSGIVDLLIEQKIPVLKNEVLGMLDNHWKRERPANTMRVIHHYSSTSYRDGLINRVKNRQFGIDELFDQYPYLLSRLDLLDNEFQRLCKVPLSTEHFVSRWKSTLSLQITKLFEEKEFVLPHYLFPDEMQDREALINLVKLFTLSRSDYIPIPLIQDFVIFTTVSDPKTIHLVRTQRGIGYPVILADKNGYRLFVGKRSIFRRRQFFFEALFQLIMVSNLLRIPPAEHFQDLFLALYEMYGLQQLLPSSRRDVVFALESQK